MDHCNELCTKDATGTCTVCEALAERDRFERRWFDGGLFIEGLQALLPIEVFQGLRRWWYLVPSEEPRDKDVVRESHKQYSETLNKTMLALLGVALFCLLTAIGSPDRLLLASESTIKIPLANSEMSFLGFIVVTPFLLIVLLLYLHIFYGYWIACERERQYINQQLRPPIEGIPTLFSLSTVAPRMLTEFIFYWLVPVVLGVITWKAWAFPAMGLPLTYVAGVVTIVLMLLQRRRLHHQATGWTRLHNTFLVFVISFMVLATSNPPLIQRPLSLFRAALSDAWLAGMDMHHASLGFANLQRAYLQGINLEGANLEGANLEGANLEGANLQGANLQGVNLQGVNLQGVNLQGVNLQGRNLQGRNLQRVNFQRADLRHAELQGANLRFAKLQGADLRYAQLQGAILGDTGLQGADLRHAKLQGIVLQAAHLQGADLRDAQLQGAILRDAQLQGADLRDAQLQGADLRDAQLQGANLQWVQIGSADLTNANLLLSNWQNFSRSPLEEAAYKELEAILIPAIPDEPRRTALLERMKAAIGQDLQLHGASAEQVLCGDDNLFPSCLTPEKSKKYADDLAAFLKTLGCGNDAIARGLLRRWDIEIREPSSLSQDTLEFLANDPQFLALAQRITARAEKNCPGWAAGNAALQDTLRKLAARKVTVP